MTILLIFIAPSALAQSPYKGGMNHMVVRTAPIKSAPKEQPKHPADIEPAAGEEKAQPSMEDQVWAKYVALAGRPQQTGGSLNVTNPAETATQSLSDQKTPATTAPGIAGLLEQYQERKEKRGQMRSLD